jgi:diguanylate cyclase (GGDEF)-like protein
MSAAKAIKNFVSVPDDPELVLAQARALTRQIPLLYAMLLANTVLLAITHLRSAPPLLTAWIPAVLTLLSVSRVIYWWWHRHDIADPAKARRTIKSMIWVSGGMAIGFTVWSTALFPYGDPYQQSHVAFYMGITTIGCMFCLMHVRTAALMVGACVLIPYAVFFATSGIVTFTAIAINMGLVVAGLLVILLGNNRDFGELVASRSEMARRQAETQRLSDENDRLANIDSLTGVYNRRSFERLLGEELEAAERDGRKIAAARMNLDSFKSVNDIFGQITGDHVLREVAERITELCPPSTRVARLSSDNFALIVKEGISSESLQQLGSKLTDAMRGSFNEKLGTVHLSASAGFAISQPGDTADTLYDRADYVTWVAKRETRGHAQVFSERDADELNRVRRMEHALLNADLETEIYILFQPQFDIALNRTTGYEVLARWHSPVLGEVSPGQFIPLAERMGSISKITQVVLAKALAASARMPANLRLSVNLSAHDVSSTTAIEAIAAQVTKAGKPCRIDFEITETAVMRDLEQANQGLLALLALGSRIALDDFGTGHSSLTHVQKLPLDRIKVDRSFVAEVTSDRTSRAIVKTTIDLCRNLGISCVFEGIETEQQLEALLGLGGTVMQGYLFGRPMTEAAALEQLAQENHGWHARRDQIFGAAS